MVDKMIRNTKIEIGIIVIFVVLSIPMWLYFESKLNSNLAAALEMEPKLELVLNNVDGYDNVIVDNACQISKKYQVLLITEENCDELCININGTTYELKNFEMEKRDNNHVYILATSTIRATRNGYKIEHDLQNKNINYYYQLEELTDF